MIAALLALLSLLQLCAAASLPQSPSLLFFSHLTNKLQSAFRPGVNSTAVPPEYVNLINSLVNARAGYPDSSGVVWYHTGVMRNPLTGAEVVGIEGLEFASRLPANFSSSSTTSSSDCQIYSESYLSRKLFVYVNARNRSEAIRSFRVRPPHSPARAVQPLNELHQVVTLGVDRHGNAFTDVAFPTGRTLHSTKVKISVSTGQATNGNGNSDSNNNNINIIDNIIRKRGSAAEGSSQFSNPTFDVVHFMSAKKKKSFNRYVSFQSPASEQCGRSQEFYTVRELGNPLARMLPSPLRRALQKQREGADGGADGGQATATMTYKRYGECPPWYAVGRAASTELSAARFDGIDAVPGAVLRRFLGYEEPGHILAAAAATAAAGAGVGSSSNSGVTSSGVSRRRQAALRAVPSTRAFLRGVAAVQSARSAQAPFFRTPAGRQALLHNFRSSEDPLDRYKPWHERLKELFRR